MTLEQIQLALQGQRGQGASFADRLRDERTAYTQNVQNFVGQTTPQDQFTSAGVPLQPSSVSANNEALLRAVGAAGSQYSPELELKARNQETDLLSQIAQLAAARQPSLPSVSEQIAALEAGGTIQNGVFVPSTSKTTDITSQINNLSTSSERNAARATKDILDVVDSAILNFRTNVQDETGTGPLSALAAQFSKLTTPNATAQLQKDLKEILRTVRKESTGVAFSPQEIKELENEIPTILQQEGNVEDSLVRLKQRMLQKLGNYGLDVSGSFSDQQTNYKPIYDEDALLDELGI